MSTFVIVFMKFRELDEKWMRNKWSYSLDTRKIQIPLFTKSEESETIINSEEEFWCLRRWYAVDNNKLKIVKNIAKGSHPVTTDTEAAIQIEKK